MLSWIKVSARRPGAPQAEPNSSRFSSALTVPLNGHIPALGNAEGFENAHGGHFGGSVFTDDLAHHQLQRQAVFALPLLGHIAQQAADSERISGLLPLAQAQLQLEHAAIGGVIAKGGAVDDFAIKGAAEKRGHFTAATGGEQLVERIQSRAARVVFAEAAASMPDSA